MYGRSSSIPSFLHGTIHHPDAIQRLWREGSACQSRVGMLQYDFSNTPRLESGLGIYHLWMEKGVCIYMCTAPGSAPVNGDFILYLCVGHVAHLEI